MHLKFIRGGAALGAATLALVAVTGCGGDGGDEGGEGGTRTQSKRTPAQAIAAVTEKTQQAKSANVDMTMSMPEAAGGDVTMSGVMGWDPLAMDLTMSGSALAKDPSAPEEIRLVWLENVMYMDMGEKAAKELEGKRWMKIDIKAAAKQSGDPEMVDQLTMGLEQQSQDPSAQIALLLDSPSIKRVGKETVEGVATEHYAGTVTLKEALASNKSLEYLGKKDRKELLDSMREEGVKEYDVDVWVDENDYPVQIREEFTSKAGPTEIEMRLTDYGAKVDAVAPPANDTVDLLDMLKTMEQQS